VRGKVGVRFQIEGQSEVGKKKKKEKKKRKKKRSPSLSLSKNGLNNLISPTNALVGVG